MWTKLRLSKHPIVSVVPSQHLLKLKRSWGKPSVSRAETNQSKGEALSYQQQLLWCWFLSRPACDLSPFLRPFQSQRARWAARDFDPFPDTFWPSETTRSILLWVGEMTSAHRQRSWGHGASAGFCGKELKSMWWVWRACPKPWWSQDKPCRIHIRPIICGQSNFTSTPTYFKIRDSFF